MATMCVRTQCTAYSNGATFVKLANSLRVHSDGQHENMSSLVLCPPTSVIIRLPHVICTPYPSTPIHHPKNDARDYHVCGILSY